MLRHRFSHSLVLFLLLPLLLALLIWLLFLNSKPAGGALTGEWRSAGPYITDTTVVTPSVVLDIESSPAYASDLTLFAATHNGLFRSRNGGASWQLALALPQPGADYSFSHVRLLPAFGVDQTVITAYADHKTGTGTLYRSQNAGTSWQPLTAFTETVVALELLPAFAQDQTPSRSYARSCYVLPGRRRDVS